MNRYDWCPGNGTRYDLVYGPLDDHKYMVCWMRRGGSGGKAFIWGDYLHHSYIEEKMSINSADANGVLLFLQHMGHEVGLPQGDYFERCDPTKTSSLRQVLGSGNYLTIL